MCTRQIFSAITKKTKYRRRPARVSTSTVNRSAAADHGEVGEDVLQQVPERSDLPVIFISAYGRDETVSRELESGAADYIVKPFLADGTGGAAPRRAATA